MNFLMLRNDGSNCLCETQKDHHAVFRRLGLLWACAVLVTFLSFTLRPTSEAAKSAATWETGRIPGPACPSQCEPSSAVRHE